MSDKDYKPDFNVYTITGEGRQKYWSKVGAAFAHRDGKKGYNIILSALPLDGKLVLIDYEEDEQRRLEAREQPIASKKATAA